MSPHIQQTLVEARGALDALMSNEATLRAIDEAGSLLGDLFERGGRVFSCGNGGSMCDAMHFAEELSGRYRNNRKALAAVAISDAGYMSCVANDYGYEHVFSRYLEAHARSGDVLVAISTSGTSGNVLAAVRAAQQIGMKVIGLSGRPGATLSHAGRHRHLHARRQVCRPRAGAPHQGDPHPDRVGGAAAVPGELPLRVFLSAGAGQGRVHRGRQAREALAEKVDQHPHPQRLVPARCVQQVGALRRAAVARQQLHEFAAFDRVVTIQLGASAMPAPCSTASVNEIALLTR